MNLIEHPYILFVMRKNKPLLLVEDDMIDAMTLTRACKELGVHCDIVHTKNGEEALNYLNTSNDAMPELILLDLNMPKMNGIEFLEKAKQDPKLKKIPVIVLTTSNEEKDKLESFQLGIAGYFVKPVEYKKFLMITDEINKYWSMSKLPS